MGTYEIYGDHCVSFTLNGQVQTVSSVPGDTSLNTYIREHARLKGTKFMCREGGCGVCTVSLQFTHPTTAQETTVAVNSCMFPVYACHGYKVTTVEGIGSKKTGYNEVQSRLAHFYGTQCGYCSPSWVMSMHSLLEMNPDATMKEIEDSFGGNLCRCTGYRPILDAFKSFASDKSKALERKVADIEDLLKVCPRSGIPCHGKCKKRKSERAPYDCVEKNEKDDCDIDFMEVALALPSLHLRLGSGSQWYKVATVDEIFEIFDMLDGTYRLVGGNTSTGIIKGGAAPDVFIDINGVAFLKTHYSSNNSLYVGAETTLTDAITLFKAVADENPAYFLYTKELAKHIEKIANVQVRNVGTIAGNLMIKHQLPSFQSDVFVILEAVGAQLSIRGQSESVTLMSLPEFLETDMYKKVILQVVLPPLDSASYIFKSFKIAPRAQNAVAYVNGGFLFKVNKNDQFKVLERPRIVFGDITSSFIHASHTEAYLYNRQLLDKSTLQAALKILGSEVNPDATLPNPKPAFRRLLTQALLYRVVLGLSPDTVSARYRSGGEDITRPLSSGLQEYDTDSSDPPLYQPYPKLESLIQCSGEAEYTYDIPARADELYAAIVIAKKGPAALGGLDASKALKVCGVVAFFSAKDIPGENTFTAANKYIPDKEQLFADPNILHAGQAVGILVAQTQELADACAELVEVTYLDQQTPVLDVRQVVQDAASSRIIFNQSVTATQTKTDVTKVITGEFKMEPQAHFPMETLSCVAVPVEDGLDVFCTAQWVQVVQEAISLILNIPENAINMKVRRVGGAFGIKLSRANFIGGACSLAAYLLQRPVRVAMKLETLMESIGKRYTSLFNYEVGVNNVGEVQYLNTNFYEDSGTALNDPVIECYLYPVFGNVYDVTTWSANMYYVKTDKPCTAWMRAPGCMEGITMAEHVMEHIAHELNLDPLDVRLKNLNPAYPLPTMISSIKDKSQYEVRKAAVQLFNQENVWKKKGISLVPMCFPFTAFANFYALVTIYRYDGTVAISHGGVEIGQGINTKAAQVCASSLGIPLESVSVKPFDTLISPNSGPTGSSFATDSVCFAMQKCCDELNTRLDAVRQTLENPTWLQVVQTAYEIGVNLNASYMYSPATDMMEYNIYGVAVLEIEVDLMTGEHKFVRADVLEDAGKSLNPFVDIGQIEGAFTMGLGYLSSEDLVYDPDTGRLLTNRTLKYEVLGAKDIPIDFRVYILKNADNPLGVLGSKAIGEPPLCMSCSYLFAVRQVLSSVRKDLGLSNDWLQMDTPFTAENIILSSGISSADYIL